MKLFSCPTCKDIVNMTLTKRTCACGRSWGCYNSDKDTVTVSMDAIVMGMSNNTFIGMIDGKVTASEIFTIAHDHTKITRK